MFVQDSVRSSGSSIFYLVVEQSEQLLARPTLCWIKQELYDGLDLGLTV